MSNRCQQPQEITDEEWLALTDFTHGGQMNIGFDPVLQKKLQATAKLLRVPDVILIYAAVEEYCDRFAWQMQNELDRRQASNDPSH